MQVDFSATMVALNGEPINDEKGNPVTLKTVCQIALLGRYPHESPDGAEKARRWLLATQLRDAVLDFTPEEMTLMKDLVGRAYDPLIVGQAYRLMNG
jgi:hypothetical protein